MKIILIAILFYTITLPYQCACQIESTIGEEKIHAIDSLLRDETVTGFSGSILISENNNILLIKGYGLADREQNVPNTENTIFEIASLTKLFTVVAILQLAEKGKLFLDDAIGKYLGDFPHPKNQATINHLLLHTAGLVPKGFELDYDTKSGFLESVKNAPVESIPGEKYRYTNAGYILLAAIIEDVSRVSYEDYLIENIFKPLQLTHTVFGYKESMENVANGYSGRSVDSLKIYKTPDFVWGNRGPSGILTNVYDLQLFLEGLENKELLQSEYLQKMFFEQTAGEAYGFHIINKTGIGKILAKGGGLPHFESQIAWYTKKNIKIIILFNNHLGTRQPVWHGIEQILFN